MNNELIIQWHPTHPIVVLDNFLPAEDAAVVLKECENLHPFFEPAKIVGNIENPEIRQNDVVYLDKFYGNGMGDRRKSKIISLLEDRMYKSEEIKAALKHSLLTMAQNSTFSEMILSRYGMCDFYGWHNDSSIPMWQHRIITSVYYINTEPEKFTGGSLMFKLYEDSNNEGEPTEYSVKPKHNRMVMFPSTFVHKVENVRVQSEDPKDWRFSVNFWSGFKQ